MTAILAGLAEGYGIQLLDEEGAGFRVGETETHYIDVVPMIWNWRVCRTPKASPLTYDRAWCFYGTGVASFTAAALGAKAWDGGDDTSPPGWDKNAVTGEYSAARPGRRVKR